MKKIKIVDTTLRDGEQTPGVVFSKAEKIKLAILLDKLGITVIEAGIPIMGAVESSIIKELISLNLKAELLVWNRIKKSDIEASLSCGATNLHLSAPVSELHLSQKLQKSKDQILVEMESAVKFAVQAGAEVSVGAEDASRADPGFLVEFARTAEQAGATRFRYADTVGILTPAITFSRLTYLRNQLAIAIEFHAHNDFGLAVANSLSSFQAGVEFISATINGIGERAGNTNLFELIKALNYFYKIDFTFDQQIAARLTEIIKQTTQKISSL
jgi:homocitrate synthase NifV